MQRNLVFASMTFASHAVNPEATQPHCLTNPVSKPTGLRCQPIVHNRSSTRIACLDVQCPSAPCGTSSTHGSVGNAQHGRVAAPAGAASLLLFLSLAEHSGYAARVARRATT